jgi:hypothetical protein
MATAQAAPSTSPFAERAQRRRLAEAVRTLQANGWEERLAPLAQHMATQRLVRARSQAGGHLRQLDLTRLREALSRLLRDDLDAGSLIVALIVEGPEPAALAAERGVSRPDLVEQLRDAVGALAAQYERLAGGDLNQRSQALGARRAAK